MRGKVARAFRHFAMAKYNELSEGEKERVGWRMIYRLLKKSYILKRR